MSALEDPAPVVTPSQRLAYLIDVFGNNNVAELLDVARSQPSRWLSGKGGMRSDNARRVIDLDYVMSRLLQVWPPEVAKVWLVSANEHLGARPIDVIRRRGPLGVLEAIDAVAQGAYA